MTRYYFDIVQPSETLRDLEGQECADLAHVTVEAMHAARQMMADTMQRTGFLELDREFRVLNEDGVVVLKYPFSRAATLK